jgi:hypothetical protein
MKIFKMHKNTTILFGFVVLKFILQYLVVNPEYDLHRDEYLYLDHANHLAWGYVSIPPLNSWIAFIIQFLGNSEFWVRFFPALFGALTLVVVWKAIEALNGRLFAMVLGVTCVLFSVLLRLNILFQPNAFDVLCWVTVYYFLLKYFRTEASKWLFYAAILCGFGFLNKYNIVFCILGLLPAILVTKQRKVFTKKELYYAILIGLIIILPNVLWQYQNNFPVVHHMKELAETQLVHVNRMDFLKTQILFFMSSLFVVLSGLFALWFYKPFRVYKPFFWAFFFTLLIFTYFKAKDYYAIGLYPIYIAFGSVFLDRFLNEGWTRYLRPLAVSVPIVAFFPISKIAFPNKSPDYIKAHPEKYLEYGLLRWEDGRNHELPQDFADMLGWSELAQKVDTEYSALSNKDQTLVLCDNYGQAGAINYYSKKGIKAVSFNADYINWFDLDQHYTNFIRIKEYDVNDEDELAKTSPYFETSRLADSIANPNAREFRTRIFVFTGAKIDVSERIAKELDNRKKFKK